MLNFATVKAMPKSIFTDSMIYHDSDVDGAFAQTIESVIDGIINLSDNRIEGVFK